MTDAVNWLRPRDDSGAWVTVPTHIMRQAIDEIEALREDVRRLREEIARSSRAKLSEGAVNQSEYLRDLEMRRVVP